VVDPIREGLQSFETSGEGSIFDLGTARNTLAALGMAGLGSVPGMIGGGILGMAPSIGCAELGAGAGFLGGTVTGGMAGTAIGGLGGAAAGALSGGATGAALGALMGPMGIVAGGALGTLAGGLMGGVTGGLLGEVAGMVGGGALGTAGGAVAGAALPILGGAAIGGVGTGLLSAALGEGMLLSEREGNDARFVANDGGGDTGLWSLMTGEERGPKDLAGIADEVGDQFGESGPIEDFEISGHGFAGVQTIGNSTISGGLFDENATDQQKADAEALMKIAGFMDPDGQIVLGGCDIASTKAGIDSMVEVAKQTHHEVTAGVSTQLPFPGIEGTQVTVLPDGTIIRDSSMLDQLYDVTAPSIGKALNWLYGTMPPDSR
jgi:hypothetical protein